MRLGISCPVVRCGIFDLILAYFVFLCEGVQDGHVVHLARKLVPATSCTTASVAAPPPVGGNSTDDIVTGAGSIQMQGFEDEDSTLFGHGLPGFELQNQISGDADMISEIMSMHATHDLFNDPRIVRLIIMNNIWILESIDGRPIYVYILSNPSVPIRNLERDRMMSNTESLPEGSQGSNMLRQRYENVHEPLLNALHNPWGTNAGM